MIFRSRFRSRFVPEIRAVVYRGDGLRIVTGDEDALASDWEAVGGDFYRVLGATPPKPRIGKKT